MSVCDNLLAPLATERFFAENWSQCAVTIAGPADKFRELYSVAGDRWIEFAAELEAATRDADGQQHQFRIRPQDIASHVGVATLCANVSADPTLAPTLRAMAAELQMPGAPFAKLYASPDGHGFALHFDAFHVFVCQLVGKKRWRYSRTPAVMSPIHSAKLDVDGRAVWSSPRSGEPVTDDEGVPIHVPAVDTLEDVVLSEGDCLYLPPGTWHVAEAVGRSVALSISPPRTPIYRLVLKALEEHLEMDAAWRRDAFARDTDELAIPPRIVNDFSDRISDLRALLDDFDHRTLHRIWRINASAHDAGKPPAPTTLSDDTVLQHASDAVRRYLVAPDAPHGADAVHFYAGGAEWSLPIEALPFIVALAAHPELDMDLARTFDPSLSADDVREILQELLAAGLLLPAGETPHPE